jgi:hypothetical protein
MGYPAPNVDWSDIVAARQHVHADLEWRLNFMGADAPHFAGTV